MALAICGCTSTQTTAARLQLNDSRLRAAADAVRVTAGETSTAVTVMSKTFISQPSAGTFQVAVTVENHSDQAVSDLPISVGYQRGTRTVYLNGAAGLDYFDDHIPSIAARGSLTWVYAAVKKLPARARTFVRIGAKPSIAVGPVSPQLISVKSSLGPGRESKHVPITVPSLTISVTNKSSVTQYQLPVYAVVTRGGRIVAANTQSVADLSSGAKAVIHLRFYPAGGDATGIRVEAPATIFK